MPYTLASVRIPAGEQPICGVLLEPYILLRDDSSNVVVAHSVPEEGDMIPYGEPEPTVVLRSRWYRQTMTPGACVCSMHPDKDATIQCMLCLKSRVPANLSYHCTGECLRNHWPLHRNYHARYLQQAQAQYLQNGAYENGYGFGYVSTGFARNNDISNYESQQQNQPQDCEWIEVGRARTYTPSLEDVGCFLRYDCSLVYLNSNKMTATYANGSYSNGDSTPSEFPGGSENARHYRISKETSRVKPAPNPPTRSMVPLVVPRIRQEGRFTVLSYNLLADLYASQGDFYQSYCPAWAISWHYRRQNLVKELIQYHCDILCLQEVQSNHYEDYLRDELARHGYEGVYKKKTNDLFMGKCSAIDGCATFYRSDRFEQIKKYEVEFNKAAVTTANHFRDHRRNAALQRLSKDNVAIIVVLESKDISPLNGERPLVCVANTHIHSVRENSDVKIWQVHTLLKGLEKIAASTKIPIIVAGDFNSEPGSAAHTLMVTQRVDQGHPETGNDPAQLLQTLLPVQHHLLLCSAYSAVLSAPNSKEDPRLNQQKARMHPQMREPLFTNYTKQYKGTLDYIFYTPNLLTPTAVLELPSDEEAEIGNGIPNARYSSDHICIMAEFQINCTAFEHRP